MQSHVFSPETLTLCALVALPSALYYYFRLTTRDDESSRQSSLASFLSSPLPQDVTDPPLLRKHSETKSYTTSRFTYPSIRVFYRPHPQADQLPTSPAPLPLLVFVHGLGGSVAQFHPLLTSLTNVAPCLAVDLPGCGLSQLAPAAWDAYSTRALVELLETVIDDYRDADARQGVVLVGHSMGSALAASLAASSTSLCVAGLVAICPVSGPPPERRLPLFRRLLSIPGPVFDLWRAWDRRGGVESPSVHRFVGADADAEAKRLQHVFNSQSKTPAWRRMAWGSLPTDLNDGLPGLDTWSTLSVPVLLVGGARDTITPPEEIDKIVACLDAARHKPRPSSTPPLQTGNGYETNIRSITDEDFRAESSPEESQDDPTTPGGESGPSIPPLPRRPKMAVESIVLPAPASHGLLYTPSTVRVVAALVSDFLAARVSGRLSLAWQLQYFSREGKWDVKNLAKWKKVVPVSGPVGGLFRPMKTLRELDDVHTPVVFAREWGDVIHDVVDISHDNPVYDAAGLERAGIRYHKHPTVSKIPPTDSDADAFVALIDGVRADQAVRAAEEGWAPGYAVGVHCHYGFNRTGYFIVCYLVERCGYSVDEAIRAFAEVRPNGIRHSHFLDRLHVRYSLGGGLGRGDLR